MKSDIFVNMQSLMFMEMEALESIPQFAARLWSTHLSLQVRGENINRSLLTMLLMRALPDQYESLKANFILYPEIYAEMTIMDLEKKVVQWGVSKKIINPSGMSGLAAAAAVGSKSPVKGNSPAAPSNPSQHINHEQITRMASDGVFYASVQTTDLRNVTSLC